MLLRKFPSDKILVNPQCWCTHSGIWTASHYHCLKYAEDAASEPELTHEELGLTDKLLGNGQFGQTLLVSF